MGREEQTAELVLKQLPPSKIAEQLGISSGSVEGYIKRALGKGLIRVSDIINSLESLGSTELDNMIREGRSRTHVDLHYEAKQAGIVLDPIDLKWILEYWDARHALGDLFDDMALIETGLHAFIRRCLEQEFGEEKWWSDGIPLPIRKQCAATREEDPEPVADPYCYTNFIHLKELLDKRWGVITKHVPNSAKANKNGLLTNLVRLNQIRNRIMHPVKGVRPSKDDFTFVNEMVRLFTPLWSTQRS